jgi:hypothetical protein
MTVTWRHDEPSRLGIEVWTYDHHFDVMHAAVWR